MLHRILSEAIVAGSEVSHFNDLNKLSRVDVPLVELFFGRECIEPLVDYSVNQNFVNWFLAGFRGAVLATS